MNAGVIDTSVLVQFVLPEEHSDTVHRLIVLHQSSALRLIAPNYVLVESANVLWKHVSRNDLSIQDATSRLQLLRQTGVALVSNSELLHDALRFAISTGITVYDALFAVLAQREEIPLITSDRPLAGRLADAGIIATNPEEVPW